MKKIILAFSVVLSCVLSHSQVNPGIFGEENWFENWTNFNPMKQEYRKTNKTLAGIITEDTTLSSRHTYLLQGVVYVTNNATLTIEPGTIIRGDYKSCGTLVVTKGSEIIAEGTDVSPIVFTSNKNTYSRRPGDWGGIIIMGDAPVNAYGGLGVLGFDLKPEFKVYGGNNPESSSGTLKYVRVEYCGRKLSLKKELNGISFAGVGNKTTIENIQISFSNDDSFEFYGGDVKMKNLISYRATDDDFDFTKGAQSIISNSIAIRHPYSSDNRKSRAFEIDTYKKFEDFNPNGDKTNVKATNITLVNVEDNDQGLIKEAIHLGENSHLTFENSIAYGFRDFLIIARQLPKKELKEFLKLKDLKISHCENHFVANSNEGINITDDSITRFFINPNLKDAPDFRHATSRKDTNNIAGN